MQNASSPWLLFEGGGFENAHACCIRQRFGMSCSLHDGSRYLSLSKQLPHGDSHLNIQSIKKTARACWHMRSGSHHQGSILCAATSASARTGQVHRLRSSMRRQRHDTMGKARWTVTRARLPAMAATGQPGRTVRQRGTE